MTNSDDQIGPNGIPYNLTVHAGENKLMLSHSMLIRRDKILMYTIRINITVFYIRMDLTSLAMQNVVYWSCSSGLLSKKSIFTFSIPTKFVGNLLNICKPNQQNRMLFDKVIEKIKTAKISRVSIRDRPCKIFPHI